MQKRRFAYEDGSRFKRTAICEKEKFENVSPLQHYGSDRDAVAVFFNIVPMFGIVSTIVVMGILGLGNVLNAGFDQIFNLYSPLVYSTGDILDTWVYRMGLLNVQFSLATAAGLFKSAISFLLIVISYVIAYKAADYRIF